MFISHIPLIVNMVQFHILLKDICPIRERLEFELACLRKKKKTDKKQNKQTKKQQQRANTH